MDGPDRPGKAILSVWELEEIQVPCELCSRPARYAVYHDRTDRWLCGVHLRNILSKVMEATKIVTTYG